jgi:hypothetical protein
MEKKTASPWKNFFIITTLALAGCGGRVPIHPTETAAPIQTIKSPIPPTTTLISPTSTPSSTSTDTLPSVPIGSGEESFELIGVWKADNVRAPDNSWSFSYSLYFRFTNTKQYVYHGVETYAINQPTDISDIVYLQNSASTFIKKMVYIPDHPENLGKYQKWTWRFDNGNALFTVYEVADSLELALNEKNISALATGVKVADDNIVTPLPTVVKAADYRPAGTLVPSLTTYIPTPLDVSSDPMVIGSNLILAALIMLPFAWATETATRWAADSEDFLRNGFPVTKWAFAVQDRISAAVSARLAGVPRRRDALRFVGVMVFYGLVFSLLDNSWNPFSWTGLYLFGSMSVAYGVVSIGDDIVQWRIIRTWGIPADLVMRPTNVILSISSTAVTRIFSLVPGLMFGTPDALQYDEASLTPERRRSLLGIGAATFGSIGLIAWLLTIATDLSLGAVSDGPVTIALGALEAFLLIVFALVLENLFVESLGFSEGFGAALREKSRWLWLAVLIGITFLFFHTLINPRGELSEAMREGNVLVFLSAASLFIIGVLLMEICRWIRRRRRELTGRTGGGKS